MPSPCLVWYSLTSALISLVFHGLALQHWAGFPFSIKTTPSSTFHPFFDLLQPSLAPQPSLLSSFSSPFSP